MCLRSGFLALVVGLPAFAAVGRAQLAPSPDAPPVSTAPAASPDDTPVASFKVNVNLVDLFFTVKDGNGNLVPHLTRQNCTVLENKVPQTLKNFVAETDQPLTLGILLDTSGSQQNVLPLEQQAGSQFRLQLLGQAAIGAFAHELFGLGEGKGWPGGQACGELASDAQ